MLGLFLKGGVWIGFGGLYLGLGLGGKRYGALEMTLMLAAAMGLYFLGVWLINSPFDPFDKDNPVLPTLYFSDHWHFELERFEAGLIKPRWESFGGYWMALIGLALYSRLFRGDKLALRMAIVGVIAGGLGFSGGQCTQSAHAWHPEWRLRLVRRELSQWEGMDPHDYLTVKGSTVRLSGYLLHYSFWDLAHHAYKTVDYGRISGGQLVARGKHVSGWKLLGSPLWRFFKVLVLKGGWRDGWRGVLVAYTTTMAGVLKYAFALEQDRVDPPSGKD
jgi:hypothetical protein